MGDNIERKPRFVLYATSGGQFIFGAITPLIADILFYEGKDPFKNMGEIMKRHSVSVQAYFNTCNQLISMGVLSRVA